MTKANKILAGIVFSLLIMLVSLFPVGNFGKAVQPMEVSANDITSHLPAKGEVNGDGVVGFTTNYVVYGGAQEVQHKVQDGWHITMKNSYYSYGIVWLECWDTDDGDYYGWIDAKYVTIYSSSQSETPITDSHSINPRSGQVAGNGVYGYTSNYVLYGGSQETQHRVQDGWHITAYNTATSHGVTWYECWDTDDGDYYGWIDNRYISFYDERPQTQKVQTSIVTVTVTVPVKVTVTQLVTVTEKVTQIETVPTTATTMTTTTSEKEEMVMAEKDDDDSDNGDMMLIIIIAVALVVLVAASAVLIAIVSKKSKYNSQQTVMFDRDNFEGQDHNYYQGTCPYCGAVIYKQGAQFCSKCGRSFKGQ